MASIADEYFTPNGRPVALVDKGSPIQELLMG
jgi:hypothetical protein